MCVRLAEETVLPRWFKAWF